MGEYFIGEPKDLYMTVYIWSKEMYQRQIDFQKEQLQFGRERGMTAEAEQRILKIISDFEEGMKTAPETD